MSYTSQLMPAAPQKVTGHLILLAESDFDVKTGGRNGRYGRVKKLGE
jgi:hypothetical protein